MAAATLDVCVPHFGSGHGADGGLVTPDFALADVDASRYSAVMFVGGWGASQYQYAFEGTYANPAYNGTGEVRTAVNQLINDFVDQDKYVAALCTGVSILAWARVDGASLLEGRSVAGYAGYMPGWIGGDGAYHGGTLTSWHVEANGGTMFASGALGDPTSYTDDVWEDGNILTAEDYRSGYLLGQVLAGRL
ncbi:MAG: cyclic nucleotide-binding protein, partial [bacterium]